MDCLHILIIDDDKDTRPLLKQALETELHAYVDIARNCAEARQKLKENEYDLITLDYQLPDGDGLEILQEITSLVAQPPVIMVTGHGDESVASEAFKLGASGYVVKDNRMNTMVPETIKKILERNHYRKELAELDEKYPNLFENMLEGFAYCKVFFDDDNRPVDWVYLDVNKAFEPLTGLSNVVGRRISEVVPSLKETNPEVFEIYGRVALTGVPEQFEVRVEPMSRDLSIKAFSPTREHFVAVFENITERRKAEESLKEGEAKYKSLTEKISDVLWTTDLEMSISYVSPSVEPVLGFDPDEYLKKPVRERVTPESLRLAAERLTEELQHDGERDPERSPVVELDMFDSSGVVKCMETALSFIRDENGKPVGVHGLSRDITNHKEAEKSERRRELAIDVLTILSHSENKKSTIRSILEAIKEFTGLEAIGIRLSEGDDFPYYETSGFPGSFLEVENYLCSYSKDRELLHDEQGRPVLECICGNILRGRADPSKYFFTEGGSFWHNSTTQLLATTTVEDRQAGTRNYCNTVGYESVAIVPLRSDEEIIGLIHLVDHRKDMFTLDMIEFFEEIGTSIGIVLAHRKAEQQLRLGQFTIDGSGDSVLWFTPEGNVIYANNEACRRREYTREEMLSLTVFDINADVDADHGLWKTMTAALREHGSFQREFNHRCKDGTLFPVGATLNRFEFEGDEIFVENLRDITERKQRQDELEAFVHMISHDLQGPLAALRLAVSLLESREELPEHMQRIKTEEILQTVSGNVRTIQDIVNDLLQMAKAGHLADIQDVDINEVVAKVVSEARQFDGRVEFNTDDLGHVRANRVHIYQLFSNLIRNAVKSVEDVDSPTVDIRLVGEHTYLVKDNGPGVSDDIRNSMVRPFVKGQRGGIGLGLMIAKNIVKECNGEIKVYNDNGACFEFELGDYDE